MLESVHHINICVSDIRAAQEFFSNLGFTVVAEKQLEGRWLEQLTGLDGVRASYLALTLPGSETRIELLQYTSPVPEKDPAAARPAVTGYRHCAFKVRDIEAAWKHFSDKGICFISDIVTNPYGKKMCYFRGPDGIILELAEF